MSLDFFFKSVMRTWLSDPTTIAPDLAESHYHDVILIYRPSSNSELGRAITTLMGSLSLDGSITTFAS